MPFPAKMQKKKIQYVSENLLKKGVYYMIVKMFFLFC